ADSFHGIREVPDHVARDDQIERCSGEVEGGCIGAVEVGGQAFPFGLPPRLPDHARREVDTCDGVTKFGESEGNEACSAANIEYAPWWFTNETGQQLEPRPALFVADEAMPGLSVEGCRPAIPVMPDDVRDSGVTAPHPDPLAAVATHTQCRAVSFRIHRRYANQGGPLGRRSRRRGGG